MYSIGPWYKWHTHGTRWNVPFLATGVLHVILRYRIFPLLLWSVLHPTILFWWIPNFHSFINREVYEKLNNSQLRSFSSNSNSGFCSVKKWRFFWLHKRLRFIYVHRLSVLISYRISWHFQGCSHFTMWRTSSQASSRDVISRLFGKHKNNCGTSYRPPTESAKGLQSQHQARRVGVWEISGPCNMLSGSASESADLSRRRVLECWIGTGDR